MKTFTWSVLTGGKEYERAIGQVLLGKCEKIEGKNYIVWKSITVRYPECQICWKRNSVIERRAVEIAGAGKALSQKEMCDVCASKITVMVK